MTCTYKAGKCHQYNHLRALKQTLTHRSFLGNDFAIKSFHYNDTQHL